MSKFCLNCTAANADGADFCVECGRALRATPEQRREGIAFLLNELEALRKRNVLSGYIHGILRKLYLDELRPAPAQPKAETPPPAPREEFRRQGWAPVASRPVAETAVRPAKAARSAAPGWLVEQQANLLLYLGAFLVVIAALVFVSYSKESIDAGVKMTLLVAYTLAFLATGVFCFRFPRVQQAGLAFFAVGALMVPLNFVGAYVFFHSHHDIDPVGLWLAGSLTSALFYGAVSTIGIGRWYPIPTMAAIVSAFSSVLALADAPPSVYPASFVCLAAVLSAPSLLKLGKVSDTFGEAGQWAGQIIVPPAIVATVLSAPSSTDFDNTFNWGRLWLNCSLSAAFFYLGSALLWKRLPQVYVLAVVAIGAVGSSLAALLFVFDAPLAVYPPSFTVLAALLAAPSLVKLGRLSDVFGEVGFWAGQAIVPAVLLIALNVAEGESRVLLNVSLCAAVFYVGCALMWKALPHAVAALGAAGVALAALLLVVDAPLEAYPGSFVALAIIFATIGTLEQGRLSEVFGEVAFYAAHLIVPAAVFAAVMVADSHTATGWYLPLTGIAATAFYAAQAYVADRRKRTDLEPPLTVAALAVAGASAVSLVYALDLPREWYGPAVAMVGWAYFMGSERIGPRWFGQRYLGWMALIAITIAWLPFEGVYADSPRFGAGVNFAAVALYLAAARLTNVKVPLFDPGEPEGRENAYPLPLAIPLVYAAGVALAIGFFHLLASLPAAEGAGASDLAWPYFGLSVGLAVAAAATRWLWPLIRPHIYVIALGLSLGVLLSAADQHGLVALLLALYCGISLALVLWEREPLTLVVPAVYGFFAVLATWRHFTPPDAYLPLALSAAGCGLFAAHVPLRRRYEAWSKTSLALAFVYAVAGPIVGWVRLGDLAQPTGYVGNVHFEATLLYETAAASLAALALLIVVLSWLQRRVEFAIGASVLLMAAALLEVGHFRPDNVQAYTAPLGIYVLVGALLALRLRTLPDELREVVGMGELLGGVLIMTPSFVQSFEHGAWAYGVILLVEGLVLVGVAVFRRRLWLLCASMGFVVADGLHYLFFSGGPALPNWALLGIAGIAVMAAGTAILFGREQWTRWQAAIEAWWTHGAPQAKSC